MGRNPLMAAHNPKPPGWELAGHQVCPDEYYLSPRPQTSQLPTCGFNAHNRDSGEGQPSSPTASNKYERHLWHQKCSLIGGNSGEIRHWHFGFVWWPEMERLDFRCLELNYTAGMRQAQERRGNTNGWEIRWEKLEKLFKMQALLYK